MREYVFGRGKKTDPQMARTVLRFNIAIQRASTMADGAFCGAWRERVWPRAPARERSGETHVASTVLPRGSGCPASAARWFPRAPKLAALAPSSSRPPLTGRSVLVWLRAEADMKTDAAEPVSAPAEAGSGPENADQVGRPPSPPLNRSLPFRVRCGAPGQLRYAGRCTRAHGLLRPLCTVVVRLLSADSAALSGRRR